MLMEHVILVDKNDKELGTEERIKAHREGKLHRAFSIFVFNSKGELLMQRRAANKYHTAGLWSNTCCSHPQPGEPIEKAVHRKLKQEMGFDCMLEKKFSFIYKVNFENGLWEHEFDHVYIGQFDGRPNPNPEEADEWKWINIDELKKDIKKHPGRYTPWFRIAIEKF